jgi:hypothetical protein
MNLKSVLYEKWALLYIRVILYFQNDLIFSTIRFLSFFQHRSNSFFDYYLYQGVHEYLYVIMFVSGLSGRSVVFSWYSCLHKNSPFSSFLSNCINHRGGSRRRTPGVRLYLYVIMFVSGLSGRSVVFSWYSCLHKLN